MVGECTGNVRSTPTPKLTLRTVNVSLHAAALAADDRALEDLHSLAVALDDSDVDLHRVAGTEIRDVLSQAVAVDHLGGVHAGVLVASGG